MTCLGPRMCTHTHVHCFLTRHPALHHCSHGARRRLGLVAGKGHLRGEGQFFTIYTISLPERKSMDSVPRCPYPPSSLYQ